MSVIFSRQCEYALQAVLYMASKPKGEMTSIRELTRKLDLPYHFLGKILQDLSRKGLLVSLRGPAGGFGLAIPAESITLLRIVEAIDGNAFMNSCVLGFPECSGENPCAAHSKWGPLREGIRTMLVGRTIAQLANEKRRR